MIIQIFTFIILKIFLSLWVTPFLKGTNCIAEIIAQKGVVRHRSKFTKNKYKKTIIIFFYL